MMHGLHQRICRAQALDGVRYTIPVEIESADSVRERLAKLGVWREMKTGRIDVPDIFRLGFKLVRRGGVTFKRDGELR